LPTWTARKNRVNIHRLSRKNPAGILDIWAKQALPLKVTRGSMLRVMMREMLRLVLRPVANGGASEVASPVANFGASFGDNIVAHSRCDRVKQPIFRQTSSLNTARGGERRRKSCAKLAQKSREVPAGNRQSHKWLIVTNFFGIVKIAELASQGFLAFDRTPIVIRSRIAAL
jgi:hypothetical protein